MRCRLVHAASRISDELHQDHGRWLDHRLQRPCRSWNGIRTALGQIVAEELDVSFARVVVVLGDTSRVPDQGPTIASETIQITAVPLRKAAAQARHFLTARAAERLELPSEQLPWRMAWCAEKTIVASAMAS